MELGDLSLGANNDFIMSELEPLSKRIPNAKHRRFIDKYLELGMNGTKAYQAVYGCTYDAARANAPKLLANASISEEIDQRLNELAMPVNEAIARLGNIARGDISDFLEFQEGMSQPIINLKQGHDAGKMPLVQVIEYDANGRPKIKMYSADAALRDILKMHGAYNELGSEDNPLRLDIPGLKDVLKEVWNKE